MEDTSPEPESLETLVERLMDEDENRRYDAGYALQRLGRPALERALGLAHDSRPRMREMACFVLGQVNDPAVPRQEGKRRTFLREGLPMLVQLLESDPEPGVRAAAAAALGQQAVMSTLPALMRAASDPSEDVRFDVAFALGSFYSERWKEDSTHQAAVTATLLRLMDDPDEEVRDWATFGIHQGEHDTPETRARLWRALDDPNVDVRGEAAAGLAKFGDRSLIPRLDRVLREDLDMASCYFEAAEELGDPVLLPAVLAAAARWEKAMEPGEELHSMITSAIEVLQKAADEARSGAEDKPP